MIISEWPLEVLDTVNYETRSVRCARCSATMPFAPWPTNSNEISHRPRCGKCRSCFTYPTKPSQPEPAP